MCLAFLPEKSKPTQKFKKKTHRIRDSLQLWIRNDAYGSTYDKSEIGLNLQISILYTARTIHKTTPYEATSMESGHAIGYLLHEYVLCAYLNGGQFEHAMDWERYRLRMPSDIRNKTMERRKRRMLSKSPSSGSHDGRIKGLSCRCKHNKATLNYRLN